MSPRGSLCLLALSPLRTYFLSSLLYHAVPSSPGVSELEWGRLSLSLQHCHLSWLPLARSTLAAMVAPWVEAQPPAFCKANLPSHSKELTFWTFSLSLSVTVCSWSHTESMGQRREEDCKHAGCLGGALAETGLEGEGHAVGCHKKVGFPVGSPWIPD
jgi:hypothetical protein